MAASTCRPSVGVPLYLMETRPLRTAPESFELTRQVPFVLMLVTSFGPPPPAFVVSDACTKPAAMPPPAEPPTYLVESTPVMSETMPPIVSDCCTWSAQVEGLKFGATAQNEADAKVLAAASARSWYFIELSKLKTSGAPWQDASEARQKIAVPVLIERE